MHSSNYSDIFAAWTAVDDLSLGISIAPEPRLRAARDLLIPYFSIMAFAQINRLHFSNLRPSFLLT